MNEEECTECAELGCDGSKHDDGNADLNYELEQDK
jgi:hypothetical protein